MNVRYLFTDDALYSTLPPRVSSGASERQALSWVAPDQVLQVVMVRGRDDLPECHRKVSQATQTYPTFSVSLQYRITAVGH